MLNLTDAEIKEVGANRFYKSNIVAIIILFAVLTLSVLVVLFGCGVYNKIRCLQKNFINSIKSLFILFRRFYNSLKLYARGIICVNQLYLKSAVLLWV
jgi:hypothetical protein